MENYSEEKGVFNYSEYEKAFSKWVENHESSSHPEDSTLADFTKLNWNRSNRIHNTVHIHESLAQKIKSLQKKYEWWVITESWCGDSAQSLPIIAELAMLNPEKISLTIFLRDKNPELMDNHLSGNSRSIPKFIVLDENTTHELGVWGPRPIPAQHILQDWKKREDPKSWGEFEHDLHSWYAKDKTQTLQNEFLQFFNGILE